MSPPVKRKSTEAVRDVSSVIIRARRSWRFLDAPFLRQDVDVALTKAERSKAIDLIQRLLDLVDDGDLAADGPSGVVLVRRLEGAVIALRAMDGTVTPTVESGRGNLESGIPESPAGCPCAAKTRGTHPDAPSGSYAPGGGAHV
jgi:hypothetical protein